MATAAQSDEPNAAAAGPAKRFQFRIRDLLVAMLLVGLLLASLVQASLWLFLAWLAALCLSMVLVWKRTLVEALIVLATVGVLAALLLPARRSVGTASRHMQCRDNLKQVGAALHSYHDTYKCFPPAYVTDKNGKPMHSWRVLILPFLDQKGIYDQYRFDEPWDGPNNRRLAERIKHFDVYRCPEDHDRQTSPETSYVAVGGPDTAWPGAQSTRLSDLKDGASNVLLVVEVHDSGIHWMEPRDLHVTQMAPGINPAKGQGISSSHGSGSNLGAQVLYGDGRVDYLPPDVDSAKIESQLLINDGR